MEERTKKRFLNDDEPDEDSEQVEEGYFEEEPEKDEDDLNLEEDEDMEEIGE